MSDDDPDVPSEEEADAEENGACFVIAPIGSDDSATRERTNDLVTHVIRPVVEGEFGLKVIVAHKIDRPGNITRQAMKLLFEADLVIADLTEHNPNVMYELAVRHATGEPVVTIAREGTTPPFDIGPQRTKFYKNMLGGVQDFKPTLLSAVEAALADEHEPDNPIRATREGFTLKKVLEGEADRLVGKGKEGERIGHLFEHILDRLDEVESDVSRFSKQALRPSAVQQFRVRGSKEQVKAFQEAFEEASSQSYEPPIETRMIPENGGIKLKIACPEEYQSEVGQLVHRIADQTGTEASEVINYPGI